MNVSELINIESRILCEEIRQEKSNKYILLGVYSGDIIISDLPGSVPLSIFIEGISKQSDGELWLRFSGPGKGSAKIKLVYRKGGDSERVSLITPRLEVLMEQEGRLNVEMSLDGESWEPLLHREIIKRDGVLGIVETRPMSELTKPAASDDHR